jgi:hypothetical protein
MPLKTPYLSPIFPYNHIIQLYNDVVDKGKESNIMMRKYLRFNREYFQLEDTYHRYNSINQNVIGSLDFVRHLIKSVKVSNGYVTKSYPTTLTNKHLIAYIPINKHFINEYDDIDYLGVKCKILDKIQENDHCYMVEIPKAFVKDNKNLMFASQKNWLMLKVDIFTKENEEFIKKFDLQGLMSNLNNKIQLEVLKLRKETLTCKILEMQKQAGHLNEILNH